MPSENDDMESSPKLRKFRNLIDSIFIQAPMPYYLLNPEV